MAIRQTGFTPPQSKVTGSKAKKSQSSEILGIGLGTVGAIAGGVGGGGPVGALSGFGAGQSAGAALGQKFDPGQADTRRVVHAPNFQQPSANPIAEFPEASTRSRLLADALASLQRQSPELQAEYTEPLTVGLVGSLAVDREDKGGLA